MTEIVAFWQVVNEQMGRVPDNVHILVQEYGIANAAIIGITNEELRLLEEDRVKQEAAGKKPKLVKPTPPTLAEKMFILKIGKVLADLGYAKFAKQWEEKINIESSLRDFEDVKMFLMVNKKQ